MAIKDFLKRKYDYFIGFIAITAFFVLLVEKSAYLQPYSFLIGEFNLAVSLIFVCDILMRYLAARDRKRYILRNWWDLLVFVPFIQLVRGLDSTPAFVIVRQVVIIAILLSRIRRSTKLINLLSLKPAQMMIATFAFAIGFGAILLMLPAAAKDGVPTSLTDALFTATSATCVTGLTVFDTGAHFSLFGQIVILGLIQVGGLGIMTFSVSMALIMGKRIDMKQEAMMSDILDESSLARVKNMVAYIVKMTFLCEAAGAAVLFVSWIGRTGGVLKTAYFAVFHAISAFCNAGFSTFSDSLVRFRADVPTNIVICGLIIIGGLGFTVIRDLQDHFRMKFNPAVRRKARLKMHTRVVLWMSLVLIAGGAAAFYFLEKDASFAGFGLKGTILASVFQSVTARTAGFNSCSIAQLTGPSMLLMMLLMFIGGSPGSTAGGVKTTTMSVLGSMMISEFRGREHAEIARRTVPPGVVRKAMIIFFLSSVLVFVFAAVLLAWERGPFLPVVFETVSAFGTVGLSADLTGSLSSRGKLLITALMFIGRLGPLTIGYAFLRHHAQPRYEYARESVAIG
ncbi:MAG: hypothetical protein KBC23_04205 [Candidatus Omnitrophica bacterium]|nr:hypothetical protein [Candidatus Omnitrophota bacterium]